MKKDLFGIPEENSTLAPQISFLATGIWWAGFAQYSFYYMPNNLYQRKGEGSWIFNGFKELYKVWKEVQNLVLLKKFLLAYFFYNMGVQTVMYVAALFGEEELKMESSKLIMTVLLIQLLAVAGAWVFSKLSDKYGNIKALAMAVVVWILICIAAYFTYTEMMFYALAAVVGSVMGGIQALSRSTYAKLMPGNTTDTASYFSFYDVTEKISIVLGTFAYGFIHQLSSMRESILALMVFFIVGLIFLLRIPSKHVYEV